MAYSPIEDKYLSALTAMQFPDEPVEVAMPEQTASGTQPGDVLLAAGPSTTMTDAGGGQPRGTIKAIEQSRFERALENTGLTLEQAGKFLDNLGQVDVPLLGKISLADFVPFVGSVKEGSRSVLGDPQMQGTPMALQQAGTGQSLTKGTGFARQMKEDASLAAMDIGLNLVPTAKLLKAGGKALAPKAAEMAIKLSEQTGMPVRGLNIVESAPQLAIDRVPGVKPGDELIVQHNLTAANLLKADKLGGLPVPSLAISKVGAPLENFGEITLIAPTEMATPSAKNPVFRSDAYTPRFPTINYSIDTKGEKSLRTMLSDVAKKLPGGDYEIDRLLNNWNDRKYSDALKAKFLDERNELPNKADFKESWEFNSELNNLVGQRDAEYQDWIANFDESLPENGVKVKERIFKGYTYSGNRRYAAATLDNIVKEMKGGAGGENFNYGVGNLRAVATPKFRTLNQIKVSRSNIVGSDKMESIKNQAQEAYIDLLNRMRSIDKNYSSEDALLEFAQSKRMSTLDRIYEDKLPNELKADIGIFLNKIQELPTEYFEMKPQRAVSLEEFKGAIIPKDTPQKARDVLKKAGITEVYEYSTPEERKGLFDRFGKEMFATMPAAPIGAATMQDKEQK